MHKRSWAAEAALLIGLATLTTSAGGARAHQVDTSILDVSVDGREVTVSLGVHAHLVEMIGRSDEDQDGTLSAPELERHAGALESYLLGRLTVRADGETCPGRFDAARPTRMGGAQLALRFSCSQAPAVLVLDNELFFDVAPSHTFIGTLTTGETVYRLRFDATNRRLDHELAETSQLPEASTASLIGEYLVIGVEHILGGIDHLLFLLTLLIVARGLRDLFWLVTSFTLAHSVTLVLGSLGVVTLPAALVEPAIALTIVLVAVMNLASRGERSHKPWLVFAFGLLHGFGFAGALAEVGLPAQDLAWALASFNVGVELGQLGVVLVLWPLVMLGLEHPRIWRRGMVPASSVLVGLLAVVWFVERV